MNDTEYAPLTVGKLREILADLPDDMPVWTTYDGRWVGGVVAVGAITVEGPGRLAQGRDGTTDRPVLMVDAS